MRTIKVVIEYDGTDYHGFGIQPRLRTVQGELERALAEVTGTVTRVVGSGRTDAGAHALGQVVSFRTEARMPIEAFVRALNAKLPNEVVVKTAEEVDEAFHARRSAQRRHYRYSVWNDELPCVWTRRFRYHVADRLDVARMNCAAGLLTGTRDFACFTYGLSEYMASGTRRTTVRTIYEACWSGVQPDIDFDIVGTAFLPHMIRNMVGSMLRIGCGKWTPEEFKRMLESQAPQLSTSTVPALGLTLVGVEY